MPSLAEAPVFYTTQPDEMLLRSVGEHALLAPEITRSLFELVGAAQKVSNQQETLQEPLTDEQLLCLRAGEEAANTLVLANMRHVIKIARHYYGRGKNLITLGELVNEGSLGLLHAVHKFDPTRGFKFSTYSRFWIKDYIGTYIDTRGTLIHIPKEVMQSYMSERRYFPDAVLPPLLEHVEVLTHPVSMHKPTGDNGSTFGDSLFSATEDPAELAIKSVIAEKIRYIVSTLDEDYSIILELYYGLNGEIPLTQAEISDKLGLSTSSTGRIVGRALAALREELDYYGITSASL